MNAWRRPLAAARGLWTILSLIPILTLGWSGWAHAQQPATTTASNGPGAAYRDAGRDAFQQKQYRDAVGPWRQYLSIMDR